MQERFGAEDTLSIVSVSGPTTAEIGLSFLAHAVFVENYTNQYVELPDVGIFIAPNTARVIALKGTHRAFLRFGAPPGRAQLTAVSGEVCLSTWSEARAITAGGPVGPASVTSNYFDRNATLVFSMYSVDAVAPAANVLRWTYTVPAGRRAYILHAEAHVHRATAATTVGRARAMVQVSPNALTATPLEVCKGIISTNAVNDEVWDHTEQLAFLPVGSVIEGRTDDTSTGGTVDYRLGIALVEFDA